MWVFVCSGELGVEGGREFFEKKNSFLDFYWMQGDCLCLLCYFLFEFWSYRSIDPNTWNFGKRRTGSMFNLVLGFRFKSNSQIFLISTILFNKILLSSAPRRNAPTERTSSWPSDEILLISVNSSVTTAVDDRRCHLQNHHNPVPSPRSDRLFCRTTTAAAKCRVQSLPPLANDRSGGERNQCRPVCSASALDGGTEPRRTLFLNMQENIVQKL